MFYYSNKLIYGIMILLVGSYVYWKSGDLIASYRGTPTKWWVRLIRAAVSLVIGYLCRTTWITPAVVLLHLLAFFVALDLCALLLRCMAKKKKQTRGYRIGHLVYHSGIVPVLLFGGVMIYGCYNINQVRETEYNVSTFKEIEDYKIALLTDIHYDTIQNNEVLRETVEKVNQQNPDMVVLGGDVVEEGTSKEKMEEVFSLLGKMKNKYGIFFVYGNHDRQPYTEQKSYSEKDLEAVIAKNGIHILSDSYEKIQDDLIVAGRENAAWDGTADRKSTKELLRGISAKEREKKFILMLDHQPIQAEENSGEKVDLQLSGHTHAGQIWPVGFISELTGVMNYGRYQRGICRVIVSSGVAGWRFPIRTGGHCEYVIVNLRKQGR